MTVGVLRIQALLRSAHSLKDKRRVLQSLKERLRGKFNVAVSEVDHQDYWQTVTLAIATVGTDTKFVHSVLQEVSKYFRQAHDLQLVRDEIEIL